MIFHLAATAALFVLLALRQGFERRETVYCIMLSQHEWQDAVRIYVDYCDILRLPATCQFGLKRKDPPTTAGYTAYSGSGLRELQCAWDDAVEGQRPEQNRDVQSMTRACEMLL